MKYLVSAGAQTLELDVERRADGSYLVRDAAGTPLEVRCTASPEQAGLLSVWVNGEALEVQPSEQEVHFRQERLTVRAESFRDRAATRAGNADAGQARKILASMPGRIVRVSCEVGAAVSAGIPLIVIEAMKMQNELCAKSDAVVRAVHVSAGQTVDRGALLVEFE